MRQPLRRHPDSDCLAADRIEVGIARPNADTLALTYIVTGHIGDIRLPPVTEPRRRDELWRHTCFEAFVRTASGGAYYEFNFAPSTQWAAYRFTGYRSGMAMATEVSTPSIAAESKPDCYTLKASLALDRLTGLPHGAIWRLGLSALIEDRNGRMSWWALAHPSGKPDFHNADSFTYEFSADVES